MTVDEEDAKLLFLRIVDEEEARLCHDDCRWGRHKTFFHDDCKWIRRKTFFHDDCRWGRRKTFFQEAFTSISGPFQQSSGMIIETSSNFVMITVDEEDAILLFPRTVDEEDAILCQDDCRWGRHKTFFSWWL